MLRNVLDAIEPIAPGLEHVHLVQGTKYYGMHLGPFRTPAREDDPRPDVRTSTTTSRTCSPSAQRGQRWSVVRLAPDLHLRFRAGARAQRGARDRRLCGDLPRARRSLSISRIGCGIRCAARHDRRDAARARDDVHRGHAGLPQRGVQRHERRSSPLARPVADGSRRISVSRRATCGRFSCTSGSRDKQPAWDAHRAPPRSRADRRSTTSPTGHFADFHWAHGYDVVSSTDEAAAPPDLPRRIDSGADAARHIWRAIARRRSCRDHARPVERQRPRRFRRRGRRYVRARALGRGARLRGARRWRRSPRCTMQ